MTPERARLLSLDKRLQADMNNLTLFYANGDYTTMAAIAERLALECKRAAKLAVLVAAQAEDE